jgi:hypothetical protein
MWNSGPVPVSFKCTPADRFACGAVLFGMLTKSRLYSSTIPSDMHYQYIRRDGAGAIKQKGAQAGADLSDEVCTLIAELLSFEPDSRPTFDMVLQSTWFAKTMTMDAAATPAGMDVAATPAAAAAP